MDWCEIEPDTKKSVKFPDKILPTHISSPTSQNAHVNKLGGLIKKGEWAWLAKGSSLQVISLKNGHTMSTFEFAETNGYDNCVIKCADELFPDNIDSVYLAVCLECMNSAGGSFIALYSVDHSNVLSCMEVKLRITSCCFMEPNVCKRSLLQNFDGCLALGSMEGALVLLDLNIRKVLAMHEQQTVEDVFIPCHIVDYNMPLREIHRHFKQSQQDGVHFGLQMEVIDTPCSVQCLQPVDIIMALAVGYEDGRLALYDLTELQIFYIAMPEQQEATSLLVKLAFLEPPDDPRPCLYIWAMHENEDSLTAVLHSLMYEKRLIDNDGFCFFETFQSSNKCLILPLEKSRSIAVSCQAIVKPASHDADDCSCLCALTWYAELEERNKLLIFDLNQWYKAEMPFMLEIKKTESFLATYMLCGSQCALQAHVNPSTIAHFNSMQRFEEHFYPNSLSFDCILLIQDSCLYFNWEGAQNRFISTLRSSNATIFLEPSSVFSEIIRTRLMPQFSELNMKATFSTNAKYETILSVALEHNCFSLLRDCAKCWVDGSFMGSFSTTTGITLSTLTNWAWKRATDIKKRCNDLCKGLFEFDGYPLDQRELKEFGFISRQLKLLTDLLHEVLKFSKHNIPEKVYSDLEHKYNSLRMATDYQDILMWLLNIGLLPEAAPQTYKMNSSVELVPYPHRFLKDLYAKKRAYFGKICENFVSKRTGSCRLIYIDAYIQHECKGNVLREYWLENNGDGLYPPTSIESMLRIMLVPDVPFESKCAILLYFFLDLNMAINDDAYKHVVANFIKFPSVFKLSASLIKTVQAFWNLDHGHFLPAVDEFISPFNKNQNYPEWVLELLIEALLTQDSSNLALRILESHSSLISPVLKLQTLLANELTSEAFHFARSQQDDTLLEQFFECCLCDSKFGVIRDLALSEREGQLVQEILKKSKTQNAENLHFVYLLQKSKYIEAVSYMDEISKAKSMRTNYGNAGAMNTPNLVLSAYSTTMTPVTQGLTDVYFRIKNKIQKKDTDNKSPVPLSCQLIKQNANNLLGGVYHSSALSAHFATYYWGGMDNGRKSSDMHCSNNLLNSNNAPFLRKPQIETNYLDFQEKGNISYPQPYRVNAKRTLAESEVQDLERPSVQENPKKRRKLLSNEIISEMSHFAKMNKTAGYISKNDFTLTATADVSTASAMPSTENFLTKPPMHKTNQLPDNVTNKGTPIEVLASTELHGILKTNTPEPLERHSMRKELAVEEEKVIRFKLPVSDSSEKVNIPAEAAEKEAVAEKEYDTNETEVRLSPTSNRKRVVARSLSTESNESGDSNSSKAISDENFYSPLSSQNNSLVVDNQSLTGPKPRMPIASVSIEKSPTKTAHIADTDKTESAAPKPFAQSTSSGYGGSLDIKDSQISSEHNTFVITSVKSLVSNIKDFVPAVSSSRVCETQSKFTQEKTVETIQKVSECSTIIGGVTYVETTTVECLSKNVENEAAEVKSPAELDTTLGMSSYDITAFDDTASKEKKPNESTGSPKNKTSAPTKTDIYDDLDNESNETETEESNSLFDESLGLNQTKLGTQNTSSSSEQTESNNQRTHQQKEDDAVIVLSSSDDELDESIESEDEDEECLEEQEEEGDDDKLERSIETEHTASSLENSIDEADVEEDTFEDDDSKVSVEEVSLGGTAEEEGDNFNFQQVDDDEDDDDVDEDEDEDDGNHDEDKISNDEDSQNSEMENIDDIELYAEELEPQYQCSENSLLIVNRIDDENRRISLNEDEEDTCLHLDTESSNDTNDYENAKYVVQHHVSETDEEVLAVSENLPDELLQINEDTDDQPSTSAKIVEELRIKALQNKNKDGDVVNVEEEPNSQIEDVGHKNQTEVLEENNQKSEENFRIVSTEIEKTEQRTGEEKQVFETKSGDNVSLEEEQLDKQYGDIQKHTEDDLHKSAENEQFKNIKDDLAISAVSIANTSQSEIDTEIPFDSRQIAEQKESEGLSKTIAVKSNDSDARIEENPTVSNIEEVINVSTPIGSIKEENLLSASVESSIANAAKLTENSERILSSDAEEKHQTDLKPDTPPEEHNDDLNVATTPPSAKEEPQKNLNTGTPQKEQSDEQNMATTPSGAEEEQQQDLKPIAPRNDERNVAITSGAKVEHKKDLKPDTPSEEHNEEQNMAISPTGSKDGQQQDLKPSTPPKELNDEQNMATTPPGAEEEHQKDSKPVTTSEIEMPCDTSENEKEANVAAIISTPNNRRTRGTTVPPPSSALESQNSTSLDVINTPTRKTKRGSSVPPQSLLVEAITNVAAPFETFTPLRRKTRKASVPPEDNTASVTPSEAISTTTRKNSRDRSIPPEESSTLVSTPKRRSLRVGSASAEHQKEEHAVASPLPISRLRRASSVQPSPTISAEEAQLNDMSTPVSRSKRGISVPPTSAQETSPPTLVTKQNESRTTVAPAKITARRRSVVLDVINEDQALIGSPSTRTRSRARLNSMESEVDTPTYEQEPHGKRSRKTSISSNVSEQLPVTPKRLRRTSVSSQPETATPKATRSRGTALIEEDIVGEQNVKGTPKRLNLKRKISTNTPIIETEDVEEAAEAHTLEVEKKDVKVEKKASSPSKQDSASSSYSSTRRLTRTQLAMFEKTAALSAKVMEHHDLNSPNSPSPPKRISKRRTSRSTAPSVQDSDDAESVVSHRSHYSSTTLNRRVTRSSVKDKEEADEELASNASSIGSEKHGKKKAKGSPGSLLLTAIPEDDANKNTEQKKRSRKTTKH